MEMCLSSLHGGPRFVSPAREGAEGAQGIREETVNLIFPLFMSLSLEGAWPTPHGDRIKLLGLPGCLEG